MIVRELLTLLGFTVDKASYDKAKRAYDSLQGQLTQQQKGAQGASSAVNKLGQDAQKAGQAAQQAAKGTGLLGEALGMAQRFAAQAGLSNLVKGWVEMASNVNETSNVLESVFGKAGQKQVEEWSAVQGAAMGRSKYSLQQYASQLGAVLGPVTKSQDDARAMSESLAQLSVDLGSFFNTTDEDAMRALRSGLTGEYESLKRYGVVLNDTTLAEVARAKGIKKKVTQMSTVEKTELRYAAIMERTKAAQGDAAKTGEGFANASKAVKEALKDLGTDIGKTVLPTVQKLIRYTRDLLNWFNKAAKNSHVLEVAMYTLAGVAAILAAEFYSAFILPALAIGAFILVVDELWTTLEGGDTLIKDWLEAWLGVEATEALLGSVRTSLAAIHEQLKDLDAVGFWETFAAGADHLGFLIEKLISKIIRMAEWLDPATALSRIMGDEDAYERTAGRGMNAPVMTLGQELDARRREAWASIHAGQAVRDERRRERKYGAKTWSAVPEQGADQAMVPFAEGMGYAAAPSTVGAPVAAPAAGGGTGGVTIEFGAPIININGGDPVAVKRVVTETMEAERKKTAAALGRRGRS